ncbi:hypothetical protein [Romboutsia sp.]|uniref:hypothetical protein n=1 Tax=Romboutsia sp. TaxID=1965302 RepID=UPI002C826790|nr:hypothetical protein [Romboutsia sp.]HSQ87517.1 hypothetical protein [Romboutsia sp.]
MRKLSKFWQNYNLDLRAATEEQSPRMKKTNVKDFETKFNISDLMLSIMTDKRLNSTEKALIGLFIEETLAAAQTYNDGEKDINVLTFPFEINVDKDTSITLAAALTTKKISCILDISLPTVFNNISSLKEKGIITFDRYKFGEFARIGFNIGYLVLNYYK